MVHCFIVVWWFIGRIVFSLKQITNKIDPVTKGGGGNAHGN